MLTADTITDVHLRALREIAYATGNRSLLGDVNCALAPVLGTEIDVVYCGRKAARARCAEFFNTLQDKP